MDVLAEVTHTLIRRYWADLERACEAALQTGTDGVLVEWSPAGYVVRDGQGVYDPGYTITVSSEVPYGTIREVRI